MIMTVVQGAPPAGRSLRDVLNDYQSFYDLADGRRLHCRYFRTGCLIYLSDTTPDRVHAAADEMIEVFRQSSVMIQTNPTRTEFYSCEEQP